MWVTVTVQSVARVNTQFPSQSARGVLLGQTSQAVSLSQREGDRGNCNIDNLLSQVWSGLISKSGTLLRRSCGEDGHCIAYSQLCEGQCGPAQCRQADTCLSELETSANFTRIRSGYLSVDIKLTLYCRRLCNSVCIPWSQPCSEG